MAEDAAAGGHEVVQAEVAPSAEAGSGGDGEAWTALDPELQALTLAELNQELRRVKLLAAEAEVEAVAAKKAHTDDVETLRNQHAERVLPLRLN